MTVLGFAVRPDVWSREVAASVSEVLGNVSTFDWVMIALAGAIVGYLVAALRAATRVGPTEIDPLEHDGKDEAPVHALTANLRERLNELNLAAPSVVPAGSPQAALVAVVGASPLPQAAFIAKLIEVLPIPEQLQFKFCGTLVDVPRAHPRQAPYARMRIWLRPNRAGSPLITSITEHTYEQAVETAAFEVYQHISQEASGAFPEWSRWTSRVALEAYEKGLKQASKSEWSAAVRSFETAVESEPRNALARLQLANAHEQIAANPGSASEKVAIFVEYLQIARDWPHVVQARYRASVLAGMLAGLCKADDGQIRAEICGTLKLSQDAAPQLASAFAQFASLEFDSVTQLLNPWFFLIQQRRLRTQFEPSAGERRQMKRAMSMSRQCLRVRALGADERLRTRVKIAYSIVVVRWWHLRFGAIRVDWQTHYIAACFEALLLRREEMV